MSNLCKKFEFVSTTKNHEKIEYLNVACSFDIETSSFYQNKEKKACMYAYVLGLNGRVKIGRTWEEFIEDINYIVNYYSLNENRRVIIYIHNLAYEFQFIRMYFKWKEVFSLEERKPVYALTTNGVEFRCSYILSNLSLAKVGENLIKYKVKKMVGDLDYSKIRTSLTPLSEKELGYIVNDGLVVMSYIQEEIEYNENDISHIPLTNTGFIRRLMRKNTIKDKKHGKYYKKLMSELTLDEETYMMAKQAFQGGFTHANHFHSNELYKNVASFDFTSSYPSVLIAERYPMSEAINKNIKSIKELNYYLDNYCCLFDLELIEVEEKFIYEHYISRSKCYVCENAVIDNGRVVKADRIKIVVTELDFKIIMKTYNYRTMNISNFKFFIKDYLPTPFIKTILDLYKNKTELKGILGKEQEYLRSKGQLNACYGMCVTDPARDEILYENDVWSLKNKTSELEDILDTYNNSKSRCLYYLWGVWTSAYARYNLWTGIINLKNDYIYADTDSLKVLNLDKHLDYFKMYNDNVIKKINRALIFHNLDISLARPKNRKGEEKQIGIWDFEGTYKRFKTLGAKRYLMEDEKGNLQLTISGVSKKEGIEYLKHKFKTNDNIFKNFSNNLLFPSSYEVEENGKKVVKNASGKMCHTYIDKEIKGEVKDYLGKIGIYHELSFIHLEPTSYSLSLTDAYLDYLTEYIRKDLLYGKNEKK